MTLRLNKNQVQTVGGRQVIVPASDNKYRAVKTTVCGITFHSHREAERYLQLRRMEIDGDISSLRRQVEFVVIPAVVICGKTLRETKYIADFTYVENGQFVVEDTKGFRTSDYTMKRKLMKIVHGIEVVES